MQLFGFQVQIRPSTASLVKLGVPPARPFTVGAANGLARLRHSESHTRMFALMAVALSFCSLAPPTRAHGDASHHNQDVNRKGVE